MTIIDNQIPYLSAADRMVEYCSTVADEFLARYNRIRYFVPSHNLTSGTANESMLRNFLAEYSTGKYSVGQGFICDPVSSNINTSPLVSRQCDIIVYDRDYPLLHSEGDIKVVLPQSVEFFIEVKTNLNKSELIGSKKQGGALGNINAAKQVSAMRSVPGLIFAFQSSTVETIVNHLRVQIKELPVEHWPTAILLLERGVIIHRWNSGRTEMESFEVRKGDKNVVMAFLVLFYFEKITDGKWGGANFVNILNKMLEYRTRPIKSLNGFKIGESI